MYIINLNEIQRVTAQVGEFVDPPIIHCAPYQSILNIKVKRKRQAYVSWVLGLIKLNTVQGKNEKNKNKHARNCKRLKTGGVYLPAV